jgi:fermentation-respiration switch protein FrsA (DUF1100 family)
MMTRMFITSLLTIMALVYIAIILFMWLFQNKMVFQPGRLSVFDKDYPPFETISVTTTDGLTLRGLYAPPQNNKPVIIYFHGNAGSVVDRAIKPLLPIQAGYGYLMAEYRGYGGNPGQPTEQGLYRDARAWIKFLQDQQHIPTSRLIYHGESLGTGVAVQMASEIKPKALILEAPFTSVTAIAANHYRILPVKTLLRHPFNSIGKLSDFDMPVLIYHGTRDITVPYRFGQQLFQAIPSQHKQFITLTGAGHANLYDHGAADHIMEFLNVYAP